MENIPKLYLFPCTGDIPKEGDECLSLSDEWLPVPINDNTRRRGYTLQDVGRIRRPMTDIVSIENIVNRMVQIQSTLHQVSVAMCKDAGIPHELWKGDLQK